MSTSTKKLYTWRKYIVLGILILIFSIPALVFIILFIIFSWMFLLMTSFSAWLGTLVPLDEWMRRIINHYFNIEQMKEFRDDILRIYQRQFEINDEMDRYWMLREMDAAVERIDRKLRNGESVMAVIVGVVSVIFIFYAPIQYAGIALTVFAMAISTVTLIRIVIIEILAYDSDLYQEAQNEEIALRMRWNCGPINGRGAILTALCTIVAGIDKSNRGYRLATWFLEEFIITHSNDIDKKWSPSE